MKRTSRLMNRITRTRQQIVTTLGLIFILAVLGACASQPVPGIANNPSVESTKALTQPPTQTAASAPVERTARPTEALPGGVEWVPTTAVPVTGEVPAEILATILDDLARRANVDQKEIQVIRAEAVVWNDGSLGCPRPGVFYTQAIVDGYWVVGEANGQKYDYRVTKSGHFSLCEQGLAPLTPAGTPES
jgi:hypothetical protein